MKRINHKPVSSLLSLAGLAAMLLAAAPARAQKVVDLDLASASELLRNHKMEPAVGMLADLANNYKKYRNVRVQSNWRQEAMATLARALRTDFDGSGKEYVPEHTIWRVEGETGSVILLAASLLDRNAVLLATDLDSLRGMLAFEIMQSLRLGRISLEQARGKSALLGIDLQVSEDENGKLSLSFFGHRVNEDTITGKLVVIEPPDLVWN